MTGLLEGLTPVEIYEKTRASFHRAWALCVLVWAPVQAINLHLVPAILHPTVVAAVSMGWQTTLSILNHYHDHGSPRRVGGRAAGVVRHAGKEEQTELEQLRGLADELANENQLLRQQLARMQAARAAAQQQAAEQAAQRAGQQAAVMAKRRGSGGRPASGSATAG